MVSLLLFLGLSSGYHWVFGSVSGVMVRPGDDIVIYCDCSTSAGVLVVWYRNCSHLNQPTLSLKLRTKYLHGLRNDPISWMTPLPRHRFVKNESSKSYDLQITNITESEEGLYFCGTEQSQPEDGGRKRYLYVYGSTTTQIILNSRGPVVPPQPSVSWDVMVPAAAVLLSNICFILLYHSCQKNDARVHTRANQVDDCFSTTVVFGTIERKTQ